MPSPVNSLRLLPMSIVYSLLTIVGKLGEATILLEKHITWLCNVAEGVIKTITNYIEFSRFVQKTGFRTLQNNCYHHIQSINVNLFSSININSEEIVDICLESMPTTQLIQFFLDTIINICVVHCKISR